MERTSLGGGFRGGLLNSCLFCRCFFRELIMPERMRMSLMAGKAINRRVPFKMIVVDCSYHIDHLASGFLFFFSSESNLRGTWQNSQLRFKAQAK